MSITVVTNPNQSIEESPKMFFGLSTDTKPTVASHEGVPEPTKGSIFTETDRGTAWVTYNGTDWVVVPGSGKITTFTHPAAVSVGVGSTQVLAANANRKYALIVNDSDQTMYLGLGIAAVQGQGPRLNANGGNYPISSKNDNFTTLAIYAICISGTKNCIATEGV